MSTISIWTIQLGRWRRAQAAGIELIDITAKSGIPAFAPDFDNVMRYKRGELSEEEYTSLYLQRMHESQQRYPQRWNSFLHREQFALGCYCAAGAFCHRHLFAQLLQTYLQHANRTVIQQGELT